MYSLFYRNPRLLVLTIFLILVWGFSSYQILPRMEDPQISQWYGVVTTRFPGASADRVEALVTEKLEEQLFEIGQLERIRSISRFGSSTITLKLKSDTSDIDEVWSHVRDKVADITTQMPEGVLAPEYQDLQMRPYTLIAALTWDLDSTVNYTILNRLTQELKDKLRPIRGTEKVDLYGAPNEEIVVEIDQFRLASLGLSPQELAQKIRLSDAKVSAGQLRSNGNNLLLEVATELNSLERIRQIPISFENKSGQFATLGNIANVKKGIREPPSDIALINGREAVVLGVLMEENQRIDLWSRVIRQSLKEFQQTLPSGIGLQIIFDQNLYVSSRINKLLKNLLLGAMCVIGSTFVLMGWKSALVVGSALPLSVLMVFGGMRVLGIPLHQISIIGLVIALGLLIDNAIVVVDEVVNQVESGLKPEEAIVKSTSYLGIPLLASTFTTVLTFMPIALMSGEAGEFVNTLAISVILALFFSWFVSLTIIPALTGRIYLKERQKSWWNRGFCAPSITEVYRRTLNVILARPVLGVLLALLLPITGFLAVSSLPEQFFPPAERNQLQIEFQLQSFASIEQTRSLVLQAHKIIHKHPQVVDVHWFVGRNAPVFYNNLERIKKFTANYAHGMIQFTSASEVTKLAKTLQTELERAFPSAQVLVRQLEQGAFIAAPIELYIYGSDLDILLELGNQARAELAQITNVKHTRTSLGEALPKLALTLDEEQTQLTGLDNTQIAQQLNANLEGTLGGSILEDTEELPVRVRLSNSDRANLDQITTLDLVPHNQLSQEDSASLPLSAIGQIKLIPETAIITRRNGQRVNTIQGFITAGVLPSSVLADFQQRLSDSNFQLPPGYSMEWGGESAERNEAVGNLLSTVGLLVVLMVATLVLSFNSFRSAGIVFVVAIGSVGLALTSLWFFDYPLGFMAILGTVGLIGVAINDSIVVLAAIRNDPQAKKGNYPAMVKVIVRSTRHVLTTTITTIAGFIPLFLDGGEFWPPLAICIAGGVGGATLLALFFVPCAYLVLVDRNHLNSLKPYSKQRL